MTTADSTDLSSASKAFSRRGFLRRAGLAAALTPAAAAFLGSASTSKAAYTPPIAKGTALDIAILNFALNLEYLEGEYYTRGTTGQSLAAFGINLSGTSNGGNTGQVVTKVGPLVPFQSPILQQYALEIAQDEMRHINFIRSVITGLGGTPVAEPNIDLYNSFNAISSNANLGPMFDPFANETNFFLGAYSLTDVGVTAYLGSATLITTPAVLQGASSIVAIEAYHSGTLRTQIYAAGATARYQAQQIAVLQDFVDDSTTNKGQGVVDAQGNANLTPADLNSIAFNRDPRSVLNIVYTAMGAPYGGFFPNGLNGIIT